MERSVRITDRYQARRDELRRRLVQHNSVEGAQQVLRAFIDQLCLDFQQTQTEPRQVRLLNALADCIGACTELLPAANKVTLWRAGGARGEERADMHMPARPWWPPLLRLVIVALLCGWLLLSYEGTLERALAGAGFGAIAVLELAGGIVPALQQARWQRRRMVSDPPPPTRPTVEVDVDVVLLRLRDILVTVDKLLDQAGADQPAQPTLPIPDALIDYLQELSAAHLTGDVAYALALARRVPGLLAPFDITLLTEPDAAQHNRFAQVASLEEDQPDHPKVIRPALLRGDITLRRGEIEVPAGKRLEIGD